MIYDINDISGEWYYIVNHDVISNSNPSIEDHASGRYCRSKPVISVICCPLIEAPIYQLGLGYNNHAFIEYKLDINLNIDLDIFFLKNSCFIPKPIIGLKDNEAH